MEAITFTSNDKKIKFSRVPIPKLTGSKDVLVKVAYSGVCGTDLHIIQGEFPVIQDRPLILGHEFSGTVVDIGRDVKNIKKGDRVVVDPNNCCKSCFYCHSGNPHFCQSGKNNLGTNKNGGWAEYVVIDEETIHGLPDAITFEQAALIEPLSCVSHGWDLISPVTVGMKILITGAGIIGSLWVCNLHLQGHRNVTVSEPNIVRLNMLKKLETGYNLITPEELKRNQESDPDYLFDLVIDCSGCVPAIEQATSLLYNGGQLCMFGVAPPGAEMKLKLFGITYNEIKIVGVRINPYSFPKAIGLVAAMGNRYLSYNNLGIKIFRLEEYKEAIEQLKKGVIAKAMFKL